MLHELPLATYDWWQRVGFDYPVVWGSAVFAVFALGACLGSFLNVCIWRIPRGESVVTAPSHCTVCGADIHWYDNLPIISYLVLRGRCRNCHTPYSCRYLIVEALTGTLFTAVLFKVGLAQQVPAVLPLYWWCILLAVSSAWIDARFRIIPDALTYPAILVGLVLHGVLPSACGASNWYAGILYALLSALIPAGFLSIFSIVGRKMTGKDVLGWGDVKFIAACGALLGFPGALFVLLSGSLSGTVYGIVLSKIRKRSLSRCSIAFGPFLAAGAVIWTLAGNWIWHWYIVFSGK
ncbi:MAG: prepilin peptidase [Lentisphaerae bacterium]|nr:prepilin peptidase [Lentisphaerota bacterium]